MTPWSAPAQHQRVPLPDGRVLLAAALALAVLTTVGLAIRPRQLLQPAAPWCLPGQSPGFAFGFASLAEQLGGGMGIAVECEHGDLRSQNTLQRTTTGLAVYDWCTNAPTF